jgi:hypothetical protein
MVWNLTFIVMSPTSIAPVWVSVHELQTSISECLLDSSNGTNTQHVKSKDYVSNSGFSSVLLISVTNTVISLWPTDKLGRIQPVSYSCVLTLLKIWIT